MWLIFAFLSLLQYAVADLFGKKCIDGGSPLTPIKLCTSCSVLSLFISIVLYLFRLGESGMAPWELLLRNPLIIINFLCFFLQWVLYLLSMKYIGLSIAEALNGSSGIFYFIGLIIVNQTIGGLSAVRSMFHPLRLIPIIVVLAFTIIYPNVDLIGKKRVSPVTADFFQEKRHRFSIGLCILLTSMVFDSLDSLITALIIEDTSIGIVDYIMTSYFITIIPIMVVTAFIRVKEKEWYIPLKNDTRNARAYSATALMASLLFVVASYFDAVRTGILFLSYPIVSIVGAKLFLKEKFTQRQTICIWIIALASIVFCASDYIL